MLDKTIIALNPLKFKELMSYQCSSVAIVSASESGSFVGLTVSSFQAVSIDPPTVLFVLSKLSSSLAVIRAQKEIGISLLGADQREIGARYSTKGSTRFSKGEFFVGPNGIPLIDGAIFNLTVSIDSILTQAVSEIFIGKVVWARVGEARMPLRYWRREFLLG